MIYRPPRSNHAGFMDELDSFIVSNFQPDDRIVFAGDFNIDISVTSSVGKDLIDNFQSHSMSPLITEVTREMKSSSTIIDHFWTNIETIDIAGIIQSRSTDHYTIFTCIPLKINHKCLSKKFRDHSDESLSRFVCAIRETEFTYCTDENDLNERLSDFFTKMYNIYDKNGHMKLVSSMSVGLTGAQQGS